MNKPPLEADAKEIIEDALTYLDQLTNTKAQQFFLAIWNKIAMNVLDQTNGRTPQYTYYDVRHSYITLESTRYLLPVYRAVADLTLTQLIMLPNAKNSVRFFVYGEGAHLKIYLGVMRALSQSIARAISHDRVQRAQRSPRSRRVADALSFKAKVVDDTLTEIRTMLLLHRYSSPCEDIYEAYAKKLYDYHKRIVEPAPPTATEINPLRLN